MRRLLAWILVTLGIAAVARRLRRRDGHGDVAVAPEGKSDPAEELRRKLAESRSDDAAPAEMEAESPTVPVDERRAEVHDRGRAALDEMRTPSED